MRLDRYANVQAKKALENLVDKPLSVVKSVIDRNSNMVVLTLDNWQDKQSVLEAIKYRPFAGLIDVPKKDNSSVLESDHKIDKVHAKMLKFALGVSKYTSNTAVFRELGQFPVSIKAKILAVIYYYRLHAEMHAAFNCMKLNSHPWINSINYLFAVHGLNDLHDKIEARGITKGILKRQITMRLTDMYRQVNELKLKEKSYLSELRTLTGGSEYKLQNYLKVVTSPRVRNIYTKVRTNSSKLSPSPYLDISENCTSCGVLRDFKHLLLHCCMFDNERKKLVTQLRQIDCFINPKTDECYRMIMDLDLSHLSNENKKRDLAIPIILSYVGVVGRELV